MFLTSGIASSHPIPRCWTLRNQFHPIPGITTDSGTKFRELSQSGIGRNSRNSVNCGIKRNRNWFRERNQFRNVQHCGIGCILEKEWSNAMKSFENKINCNTLSQIYPPTPCWGCEWGSDGWMKDTHPHISTQTIVHLQLIMMHSSRKKSILLPESSIRMVKEENQYLMESVGLLLLTIEMVQAVFAECMKLLQYHIHNI